MKITIEELDRQAAAVAAKKEELATKEAELTKKIEELKATAATLAESGELEDFKATEKARQEAETDLFVTTAQLVKLRKNPPIAKADAAAAWAGYAEIYNGQFSKKLADYENKRRALLDAYKELVDLQAEAITVRERLAGYLGIKYDAGNAFDNPIERVFPCSVLPCRAGVDAVGLASTVGTPVRDPDAVFFLCYHAIEKKLTAIDIPQDSTTRRINAVVNAHRTKSPF